MGMFSSIAEKAELTDLLKWVECHKESLYNPSSDLLVDVIIYSDLITELKKRISEADLD